MGEAAVGESRVGVDATDLNCDFSDFCALLCRSNLEGFTWVNSPNSPIFAGPLAASRNMPILAQILAHRRDGFVKSESALLRSYHLILM